MGNHSGEAWAKADLFFLTDALDRRISLAEVAAFLGRTEEEVREKAERISEKRTRGRPWL
jgi:hypothetical protein